MTYKLGTSVKVSAAFSDLDGTPFDPTTVTCEVQKPSDAAGAKSTYEYGVDDELVKDAAGEYHLWIATDETGTWAYGFTGIDADGVEVANSATFEVETDFR